MTSLLVALAGAHPAFAQSCETLEAGPSGRVVSISDGDTVDLDTGLTVRLVGIQAPKLPLGREGFEAWPLGDDAKALITDLVLGEAVTLYYGGERRDRHGRALAHLMVEADGEPLWVQEEMLRAGLARVYSFADNRSCLDHLLAAEAQARADRLGIWRDPYYAIRDAARPQTIPDGGYELVEGRVLNADRVGGRVFLNFGRDWRTDFTLVVESQGLRVFESAGIDPLGFENTVIRVRGWVDTLDGPRMAVTHPEQIELLARP
ncbi:thermonuclease family protein [Pelagibacterium lacus]|uniref:thermonuclease family protein n=1 Tax=Pelagibacterium lacus TaxID=2282655 RepID=UPI001FE57C86|nr:thermonuclease family protein [Pelagibacterium lacus]